MQRVKTATAVANKPPYSEAGVPAFFTAGDAVAGIPATAPGQDFFNMVQEELLNLIKAAGLTPSAVDDTQLREAVFKLILAAVAGHNESGTAHADIRAALAGISIPAASETVAGILKLASQAAAIAGVGGGAITPETLHGAIAGVVRGYTRQQHPAQVSASGVSGTVTLDLELHQAWAGILIGASVFANPGHMVEEMTCTVRLYSATAQTVSWASAWVGNGYIALPTVTTAGKWITCYFECVRNAAGTLTMRLAGLVPEA